MKYNRTLIISGCLLIFTTIVYLTPGQKKEILSKVKVQKVPLTITLQATGNIEPLNRVEILPPVAGRIEEILVEEDYVVKKGETIAWMSSTSRAVLLDITRTRSPQAYEEWKEMYLPTPIIAPVTGRIISKKVVPGQTVNQESKLFEMSDRLVVRAQVDETDIGKIKKNMEAQITVDAYPNMLIEAHVNRISHQSELINNVNVFEIELLLSNQSEELRSGMTTNVDFIIHFKKNALVLPSWAVQGHEEEEIVIFDSKKKEKKILLGLSNGVHVEVLSNVKDGEEIFIKNATLSE